MNQAFTDILQKLAAERGKEVLLDPAKCKAFLADYTRRDYKKESRFLLWAIEAGTGKAIDSAPELGPCKQQQTKMLREEYGLAEEIAKDVVDTLALVLRGGSSKGEAPEASAQEDNAKTEVPETFAQGNALKIEPGFVWVEGGTFLMGGSPFDEQPHSVTMKGFYMGKYQVTQKEWVEVMGHNPSHFKYIGADRPVDSVSWFDAVEYCNKRSIKERLTPVYRGSAENIVCDFNVNGYRLPTETEWEFAAKGGNKDLIEYTYSGSNNADAVAWYKDNNIGGTHDVGMKMPNSLGIYDMSGNVREWCWDRTEPYWNERVWRGGGWRDSEAELRSIYRSEFDPSGRYADFGFRLARSEVGV